MMHFLTPQKRAFTLVETLVAITLLMVVVVGPLYAVFKSVSASYAARDQLIATALAQEGIEYARNVRDSNYLEAYPGTPSDWLDGLESCYNANGCTIDPNQENVTVCPSTGGCPALRQNLSAATGVPQPYLQTTSSAYTPTRFTRKITMEDISATEVLVTVTVSWRTLRVPYSVTVEEHLYNWL